MILGDLWGSMLLHLQKFVGLEQYEVDLLKDFEIDVDNAFITCLTI